MRKAALMSAINTPLEESRKRKPTSQNASRTAKKLKTRSGVAGGETSSFDPSKTSEEIRTTLESIQKSSRPLEKKRKSVFSLCGTFSHLLAEGRIHPYRKSTVEDVLSQWFLERYEEYKDILLDGIEKRPYSEGAFALELLMLMFREEVLCMHARPSSLWTKGTFASLVEALLRRGTTGSAETRPGDHPERLQKLFLDQYVQSYQDNRYYFFVVLKELAEPHRQLEHDRTEQLIEFFLLAEIKPRNAVADTSPTCFSNNLSPKMTAKLQGGVHIKEAAEVWASIMKKTVPNSVHKKLLRAIPHNIVPWYPRKEALMDFLSDAFDAGGSTSLLALGGLLDLIQNKGLDYPQFYTKLYAQVNRDVLHSKHRSRFLRLMDTALQSSHLPAVLVASFIKRLSRLCLFAPPSAIVVVVPWIYNMLKTHPACRFLIHRVSKEVLSSADEKLRECDPFDMEATDPMDSHAIDSSLWEIVVLQSHYHPNVSAIASIISQQFLKQSYNLEDFLDHTYGSVSGSAMPSPRLTNCSKDDGSRAVEEPFEAARCGVRNSEENIPKRGSRS